MPILPDAPNTLHVRLIGTNQGTNWSNGFYLHASGALGSTSANLDTLAGTIATSWSTNIGPLCNNAVFLNTITIADLTTRTSPAITHTVSPAAAGTRGTTVLPTSVALVMSFNAARRYRGGHPRIYIPAGLVADVTSGRLWNPAPTEMLADANAAAAAIYTAWHGLTLGAVGVPLTCVSFYESVPDPSRPGHNHSVLRSSPAFFDITGARVRTRVDTQRLRLGKETS